MINIAKIIFKKLLRLIRSSRFYIYYLKIFNVIKYGLSAPKPYEIIWVNPRDVKRGLDKKYTKNNIGNPRREASGKVIESEWPTEKAYSLREYITDRDICIESLTDESPSAEKIAFRIKCCLEHWQDNIPWEDTGIFKFIEIMIGNDENKVVDGCKNMEDITLRYKNLDKVFEQVSHDGKFRIKESDYTVTSAKLNKEQLCIIHLGPDGEPYFHGGAWIHRFAMAYILDIPFPAQIGLVHWSSLKHLNTFRMKNSKNNKLLHTI